MKILFGLIIAYSTALNAFYDEEFVEKHKIDATIYNHPYFGLFLKYEKHWFRVNQIVHHEQCPECPLD